MKILHVETRHRRGGAERNVLHTMAWEMDHGHEVHLAVGRDSLIAEVPRDVHIHVVPHLVRTVSPLDDLRAFAELRRLIRRERFELVHTHQSKAGVLGRFAAWRTTRLVVHTVHMASFGPAYGRAASGAFAVAERICSRWTDVLVFVGEELRDMYTAAGVGSRSQRLVIRSPIDIAGFAALRELKPVNRNRIREEYGLPHDTPVVLVVASLEPRKRVEFIVHALSEVLVATDSHLVVAGDGPELQRLRERAKAVGVGDRVHLLGHVDDVRPLYGMASLLVHAATVEGVPQVVIQALAAGVPVVSTPMVGISEIRTEAIKISADSGLAAVVQDALLSPPPAIDVARLSSWTAEGVDQELLRLHQTLGGR